MKIKTYTNPACPWCIELKAWLKKKKIEYEDLDITEEDEFREELVDKTGQLAVPVVLIGDNFVVGFNPKKIEELIKNQKE
ncbi:glutaredoxin family protein [archaeon]|jgi:glutaredoxin 3|nr:glutaredoxin family protein [archaeon]MBT3450963.1 glutaredoxin family protein [archaeon]MBT6869486.1 glutaredoxin family protein [archaeon]MBT7193174.1 glutaredoxin family protein [archaeon]MBT7380480.1 glutaredoxin family protein [archaeon]